MFQVTQLQKNHITFNNNPTRRKEERENSFFKRRSLSLTIDYENKQNSRK